MNKNFEKVSEEDLEYVVGGKSSVEGFSKKPQNIKNANSSNILQKSLIEIFSFLFKPKNKGNQKSEISFKKIGGGGHA